MGAALGLAFGLGFLAAGCGGSYKADPIPGGSKGPEMKETMTMGPRSVSASQMSQSTPSSGAAVFLFGCGAGVACTGTGGCISGCDPDAGVITACASCDNAAFTKCTQSACVP